MSIDPAVRSIRIATTLNERFGAIMRNLRGEVTTSDLELSIGEAQQIYPEIWRHLDEARTELAGRAAQVRGYDAIRATIPLAQLGVTSIEIYGTEDGQVKSAQFNLEGFRTANTAIQALMSAMPAVDWQAQAVDEAREIAAAGSLSAFTPRRIGVWVGVLGGAAALVYAFWFFLVRTPKTDWTAVNKRERAERLVKIDELKATLETTPCSHDLQKQLDDVMFYDVDTREQRGAVRRDLKAKCKAQIAQLETILATTPCDKVAQKALSEAIMGKTGSSDAAMVAAEKFRSQCAIGAAADLPPPTTP